MLKIIEKLNLDRYLNSWLVLGMDLFISGAASLFALMLARQLFPLRVNPEYFAASYLALGLLYSLIWFLLLATNRSVIRHATLRGMAKFGVVALCKGIMLLITIRFVFYISVGNRYIQALIMLDMLLTLSALVLVRVAMILSYDIIRNNLKMKSKRNLILVYGTSEKSVALVTRLDSSPNYQIAGFLTYGRRLHDHSIADKPVYYFLNEQSIKYLKERIEVDAVLFATNEEAQAEQQRLINLCVAAGIKILISPPIDEVVDGKITRQNIRAIRIEDLLGREEISISLDAVRENFHDKTILVTGAAGSIGSELCRQLASFGVKRLILFDNAETPMHQLQLELEERFPELALVAAIGDVRLASRLDYIMRTYRPEVVFHAAAYKHVPLMEENPCEAVMTNVTGTRNVADKCLEYDVEKMVMISTDKAVNPTNVMGCTKRLAEIYVQSLGLAVQDGRIAGRTKFVTTRFGNVLGSNGSVIPRFRKQIEAGGPVTVTHPDITRFFMTIPEACQLVMEAATMSTGNQIFVFDMGKSIRIADLASRMIRLAGVEPDRDIEIRYTGLRPGEKLYEEVLSNTENTLPTPHDRIRIARVREYDYGDACAAFDTLDTLSLSENVPDLVRLMKRTVPEYKSKNSTLEQYDNVENNPL